MTNTVKPTELSRPSEGQRVAVYYGYDNKRRLIRERADGNGPADG